MTGSAICHRDFAARMPRAAAQAHDPGLTGPLVTHGSASDPEPRCGKVVMLTR